MEFTTKKLEPYADRWLDICKEFLLSSEIIALPTETVYGLCANALDSVAVSKIFAAKGRPGDNPLIVHISSIGMLDGLVHDIPQSAKLLAERFWPGPLTMILPKKNCIPSVVSCGLNTVGIRFPSNPIMREVIDYAHIPLAAPSANLSGSPSPTCAQHVINDLDGKIPLVVNGGSCSVGLESTVIDLTRDPARILRPGSVTFEQISEVLSDVTVDKTLFSKSDQSLKPLSPGMKYRHYAPKCPIYIISGKEDSVIHFVNSLSNNTVGILCFDDSYDKFRPAIKVSFGHSRDYAAQARNLFDALRKFDHLPVDKIYAQCPENVGLGRAVCNRLFKASGFNIINV